MRHHPCAQGDAFTDVQRDLALAVKHVDAGRVGHIFDGGLQLRRHAGTALEQGLGLVLQHLGAQLGARYRQKSQHQLHITHGPVARQGVQAVALAQGIEPVAFVRRVELARQAHSAQGFDLESQAHALKRMQHKAVVKAHVMGHKHRPVEQLQQARGHVLEAGRFLDHGVADAGQALDECRNAHTGVDQRAPARDLHAIFQAHGGDFGDAVVQSIAAGGLQIDDNKAGQHAWGRL